MKTRKGKRGFGIDLAVLTLEVAILMMTYGIMGLVQLLDPNLSCSKLISTRIAWGAGKGEKEVMGRLLSDKCGEFEKRKMSS
jgi:hypothetical protein